MSWNYEVNKNDSAIYTEEDGDWTITRKISNAYKNFANVLSVFLCQDVLPCFLRDHDRKDSFIGPRFLVRTAGLDMHPNDSLNRIKYVNQEGGIGLCNITKCCTEVCPESIHITDNAIIPLKERVVDRILRSSNHVLKQNNPQ